eukprot:tig00020960_g16567.t1
MGSNVNVAPATAADLASNSPWPAAAAAGQPTRTSLDHELLPATPATFATDHAQESRLSSSDAYNPFIESSASGGESGAAAAGEAAAAVATAAVRTDAAAAAGVGMPATSPARTPGPPASSFESELEAKLLRLLWALREAQASVSSPAHARAALRPRASTGPELAAVFRSFEQASGVQRQPPPAAAPAARAPRLRLGSGARWKCSVCLEDSAESEGMAEYLFFGDRCRQAHPSASRAPLRNPIPCPPPPTSARLRCAVECVRHALAESASRAAVTCPGPPRRPPRRPHEAPPSPTPPASAGCRAQLPAAAMRSALLGAQELLARYERLQALGSDRAGPPPLPPPAPPQAL